MNSKAKSGQGGPSATSEPKSNRFSFGIGTIGRDMVYTLISMYLIYYLTDVVEAPTASLWWITGIILFARIFDALNDPVMGLIVDNTKSRFGKFKPWIAFGAFSSGIATVLLFTGFPLNSAGYVALFGIIYILWGVFYTTNDIAYWSMIPSLSQRQSEREVIGSVARICANIGLFFVVAGIVPITTMLGESFGGLQKGYLVFAGIVVAIMWIGQLATIIGVKQPKIEGEGTQHTRIGEMVGIILKNDQLFVTAIAMILFMTGYMTTTSFGIYYFKYVYGDEAMYSIFAIILGVSQLAAITLFPFLAKRFARKSLYSFSAVLIFIGYFLFFLAPAGSMPMVGAAGVLIFTGEAFIQVMMLMFLADSVDYGHWKLGKRNDSITFSIQPLINKAGGAVSSAIVSAVVILSGMKDASGPEDVSSGGLAMVKVAMLIFPLICIIASYVIYRAKYKIDAKFYDYITGELEAGRTSGN
ncbi:MAG: glycoside-pentoside-hexuronide (GPH):cation symporter [Clostridiales bacterium]|nr:glycoside-pentoside-hexuronide (GPH):cation symporter [Clostridiales bacterium]